MNQAAQKAQELLDQVGINSLPVKPQDICSRLGIAYREHPFDGFEGILVVEAGSAMIGVNSNIETTGRKAYTAGHELGHYCLHVAGNARFECTSDDTAAISKSEREVEANAFAAELMMPTGLVQPLIRADSLSWDIIKSLAQRCETSLTAAAIRFIHITELPCAMILAQDGMIKFYRASPEFQFRVDMDSRMLAKDTAAFLSNSGGSPINDFSPGHPDRWLTGRFSPESEILEWSLPKNRYDQVLTLLLDEGDVRYAKDGPITGLRSMHEDDDEDGLGVDKYMNEVNPFQKRRRRR